ncbi:MAG: APC family permease [Candidatus Thermoplasmatota archaeon]|jgi:amino acid transporter|nr:APC family permease [Candidatus Thermoplasmatota archaeon]
MSEELRNSILAPIMQSFTSIGPMLDTVAIFSVIAIYSGVALPIVVLMTFLLGYSTMNTLYRLSSRFVTNGGYYAYAGLVLGKDAGIFVGFVYLAYAMMVLPDISLFIGNFAIAVLGGGLVSPLFEFGVSLGFTLLIIAAVSRGLKLTLSYTIIAGILEFLVLGLSTGLFFSHSAAGFPVFAGSFNNPDSIWLGLIFGIVAFSGSGSSIFFSNNVKKPLKNIPRGMILAYTISGIIMILASLSLVFFLGSSNLARYSADPYFLMEYIRLHLGSLFFVIFAVFAMISAANLSISYLNALKNGFARMLSEGLLGSWARNRLNERHLLLFVLILALSVELLSYFTNNFFYAFAALAGAVGLAYMTVHIITNVVLMKVQKTTGGLSKMLLPVISSAILLVSFYYAAIDPSFSLLWTNVLFLVLISVATVATIAIRLSPGHYKSIVIIASQENAE